METEFHKFFANHFGERWPELLARLEKPSQKTALESPYPGNDPYLLDPASLVPIQRLLMEEGQSFLDVCSAPGGKALAAIFAVQGNVRAHLNDLSPGRVARLKAVLHDFLPTDVVSTIKVSCFDGARLGQRMKNSFDRVLADVPCSAERHHLHDRTIREWTPAKSKRMAIRQHALLCSALDATVEGGRVVYSTCSLSPFENDGVIQKLFKSRKGRFRVAEDSVKTTEFGDLILPDRGVGGPIFVASLEKT